MSKKIIYLVWPLMLLALMLTAAWAATPDGFNLDKPIALSSQSRAAASSFIAAGMLQDPLILARGGRGGGGGGGRGGGGNADSSGGSSVDGKGPRGGQQLGKPPCEGGDCEPPIGQEERVRNQHRYRYQDTNQDPKGEQQQHRHGQDQ